VGDDYPVTLSPYSYVVSHFTLRVAEIVEGAIHERIFPGAVVLVARDAQLLHLASYGSTMYDDPGSAPVALDALFDIASITKIVTATAALRLIDAGQLDIDAPLACYLPQLRAKDLRLRHLLTHSSGLDLRLSALREHGRDGVLEAVYAAEPVHPPGQHVAYTNVNSLLLGELLARVTGQPLDVYLRHTLLEPLGMHETSFRPPAALLPRIVPTEHCDWRKTLVRGLVHDESAYALGGVAGHAGLFSSARDLWRFGRMWLNGGALDGRRYLSRALADEATRVQTAQLEVASGLRCGLGWMLERPAFMGANAQGSYGHTGFTGPILLVQPQGALIAVLLCNRTYPRRHSARTHDLMARLVDLAW
jgi:CubicO group peptidase (beta-lactamase class C family)